MYNENINLNLASKYATVFVTFGFYKYNYYKVPKYARIRITSIQTRLS